MMNTWYLVLVITLAMGGVDSFFNPNVAYVETRAYQEIVDFFQTESAQEICVELEKYRFTRDRAALEKFVTDHPILDLQFQNFEKIGQTLIYVTRKDADSLFVNAAIRGTCLNKGTFNRKLDGIEIGPQKLLVSYPRGGKYYGAYFYASVCPPFTEMRGQTDKGILCSRYELEIQNDESIPILFPGESEDVCSGTQTDQSGANCTLGYNDAEQARVCRSLWADISVRTTRDGCIDAKNVRTLCFSKGFTICGNLKPDRPPFGSDLPLPSIGLCCTKITESNSPLQSLWDTAGAGKGELDVERLYRFLVSVEACNGVVIIDPTLPVICEIRTDLILAMDASGSIQSHNFEIIREFILRLSRAFLDKPEVPTRLGIIVFDNQEVLQVPLNSGWTQDKIEEAIHVAPYTGGGTRTDLAIDMAIAQFGQSEFGVPRKLVIITDGGSNEKELTKASATKASEANIKAFTVGIGDDVDNQELLDIAGGSVTRVFETSGFDQLLRYLRPVSQAVCND